MKTHTASLRRLATLGGALVGTVAAVFAMSLPAYAASDYTPGGGPDVTYVGSNVAFTVDSTGQELDCPTFNLLGSVIDPGNSRAFGDDGLLLDDLTAIGCTNPVAGPTDVTPHGNWKVAVVGPEVGSVSPVNLHDVEVTVNALSGACEFDVTGDLDGTFDDASQVFDPTTSNLEVATSPAPSGPLCEFLGVDGGVHVSIDGDAYWTNVPPSGSVDVEITNP